MKKIITLCCVLIALAALTAAPAYANPGQAVAHFDTHLSGDGTFQGEVQFDSTPCGSGLNYKVMLESLPAGVASVVHLHLQGIKDPVGVLDEQGMLTAWISHGSTLLIPSGMKAKDLYITQPYDENGEIHYKQLQGLVEDWLVPGKAYVDVHLLERGKPGPVILTGQVAGQFNGEWPALLPFVLDQ